MTAKEFDNFERALVKAVNASRQFEDSEDGGTCNFDTPVIRIKATAKQMYSLDWHAEKIGGRTWRGYWFLFVPLAGQANRRTRMAEAVAQSLAADGYDACVYYQVD